MLVIFRKFVQFDYSEISIFNCAEGNLLYFSKQYCFLYFKLWLLAEMLIWYETWFRSKPVQVLLVSRKKFELASAKKVLKR